MLGQSGYSRAMLPNVREIERRLRSLDAQRRSDCLSASVRESPNFLKSGLSIRFKGA
jgi:hypothetical protein